METELSRDEKLESEAASLADSLYDPQQPEFEILVGFGERGTVSGISLIRPLPMDLREGNEKQFTPTIVSIGPIHAFDPRLRPPNRLKVDYSRSYVQRFSSRQSVIDCYKELASIENEVRGRYDKVDVKSWESKDFVEMMFIDGCFILELLIRLAYGEAEYGKFGFPSWIVDFLPEVFMLENQIPFLVLSRLFKHAGIGKPLEWFLLKTIHPALCSDMIGSNSLVDQLEKRDFCHLLDFAWHIAFPQANLPNHIRVKRHIARSVTELELHGIKTTIERQSGYLRGSKRRVPPFSVKYKGKILELPTMRLDDVTTTLYWNLLAYEQQPDFKEVCKFQSFIIFMNTLIKTENDVKLLQKQGILAHKMEHEERLLHEQGIVEHKNNTSINAMLFRDLAKKVRKAPDTIYASVIRAMADDCVQARWQATWKRYVQRYYHPEDVQSILLFILTVTQTIYAVLSYKPERKKN